MCDYVCVFYAHMHDCVYVRASVCDRREKAPLIPKHAYVDMLRHRTLVIRC